MEESLRCLAPPANRIAGGGVKSLISYIESFCCPAFVGLLPSAGKREYDGFRACDLACTAGHIVASSGIFGKLLLISASCLFARPYGGLLRESIEIPRPFSSPMRLARLSERLNRLSLAVRGPVTGLVKCACIANSFGPNILISCLGWAHFFPAVFGANDVVAVLDRKNSCSRPLINPDRFKTTVAIMASLISPCLSIKEKKNGTTNARDSIPRTR